MLADLFIQLNTYVNERPETRYLNFMKYQPQLLDRITQKQLANYIGITSVSLKNEKET